MSFDRLTPRNTDLDGLVGAYEAMDERRATKALIKVSSL